MSKQSNFAKIAFAALSLSTFATSAFAQGDVFDQKLIALEQHFDQLNFATPNKSQRMAAEDRAIAEAEQLAKANPGRAEPLIWEAIILGVKAKDVGAFSALPIANQSKALLERSIKMNPNALNGGAFASLGAMYTHVPGPPIAFGDKAKAKTYLQHALSVSPNDVDANYFMADLLYISGDYKGAYNYAERSYKAPARANRAVGDTGRKSQALSLMNAAKKRI